ncbi:MAG: von Willebrand factor, type, partial [Thermoleophilia bacterium]|nr:von Willebrand factor, type [Thermoleophilia bacterium]
MHRFQHAFIVALLAFAAVTSSALAADTPPAAPDPESGDVVTITDLDTTHFPTVRVAFGADEHDGEEQKLSFYENGARLSGVSIYRGELGRYEDRASTDLMLVLDTSLSMRGTRIVKAQAAARRLISQANPTDRIGLATFGGDAQVVLRPTTNRSKLTKALDSVPLRNRTTLFDGVEIAAKAFAPGDARRAIVLLSDGADTGGSADVDDASGAALKAGAPVFSVSMTSDADEHPKALEQLGNGTGGMVRTVADDGDLGQLFS